MARRCVYAVAIGVVLVIATLLGLNFWARELSELAFTPSARFSAPTPRAADAYRDGRLWISRGAGTAGDPARWLPHGLAPAFGAVGSVPAAVFFVHPTSYMDRARWNAPVGDRTADDRAEIFTRGLASPFNAAREVWAPRYRQATFGAFLTSRSSAQSALQVAYRDVLAAFDAFVAQADPALPIVLVGHSQGALHLMHLMQDRIAGKPLARRVAAAYIAGWPVSIAHDLPAMGLPACAAPDQAGCVLAWQSYGEPADPGMMLEAYARVPGLDGQSRKGSAFLCTNPLTGTPNTSAPASANLGTLIPETSLTDGTLVAGSVAARCAPNGLLLVGAGHDLAPPAIGPYVMPGNNYHVYDIPLFWANLRADMARRVAAWEHTR